MSVSASCLVVRNLLREGLADFYDANPPRRNVSCKVQPDYRPDPIAGEEFIAIYGSEWSPFQSAGGGPGNDLYGLHEVFGVTVAVTRRLGITPYDRSGEVSYIADEDVYISQYMALEARIREINRLIHTDYVGQAEAFLAVLTHPDSETNYQLPYEKLSWIGSDASPIIVGPSHFHAEADTNFSGLMMQTRFRGAPRLHVMSTVDTYIEPVEP